MNNSNPSELWTNKRVRPVHWRERVRAYELTARSRKRTPVTCIDIVFEVITGRRNEMTKNRAQYSRQRWCRPPNQFERRSFLSDSSPLFSRSNSALAVTFRSRRKRVYIYSRCHYTVHKVSINTRLNLDGL